MTPRRLKLHSLIALQTQPSQEHLISDLTAFPVREPVSGRAWTVIRLRTVTGLVGWGEGPPSTTAEVAKARTAILNRPATAWATLPTTAALHGALDIALLDISAKISKAPLFRFLGGPTRFKVRALTTAEDPAFAINTGYKAIQVPLPRPTARNLGRAYHQAVVSQMDTLRSNAPAGVNFVLGGNATVSAGDAAGLAAELERFHLLWFDEPAPLNNLATIRKISEEAVTPLGFGRTAMDGSVYQDLLREGIADVLRPDIHQFGISGIRRIGALAETYYVAVAPNHQGGPIATAAAIHLAAALPNFFVQHVPLPTAEQDRTMRSSLAGAAVEAVRDGFLSLPAAPGLGVEINEDALRRYKDSNAA